VTPRGLRRATVTRVITESDDARTFVLSVHDGPFEYRAGQFCTFQVSVDGRALLRSYSMSSSPEVDAELMTTVKRVPGGRVSNWLVDNVREGDELDLTGPAGRFCLRPGEGPVLGFSGGSGITPILSLAKSALAATDRAVRLLCADRDRDQVLFASALAELGRRHPGRLTVVRHLDERSGYLDPAAIGEFVGPDTGADAYVCGPEPFLELVESVLRGPGRVFRERFGGTPDLGETPDLDVSPDLEGTITIRLGGKQVEVARRPDETLLRAARRGGLYPPFSCEAGACAACLGRLLSGTVKMRNNDILTDDEVAQGYVLTCQAVPESSSVTVRYQ
jgi:3-ketosteroid 9alpha-monooxygenase subunit B